MPTSGGKRFTFRKPESVESFDDKVSREVLRLVGVAIRRFEGEATRIGPFEDEIRKALYVATYWTYLVDLVCIWLL